MKIIALKITGMTCDGCSAAVERVLETLPGIESKEVDYRTDSGTITFDENQVSQAEIIARINQTHYKVKGMEEIKSSKATPCCPRCGMAGSLVPNTVFRANVIKESLGKIDTTVDNFICMNPDCEVAYYRENQIVEHSELKRELWFKNSARRRIICYCNNIDSGQIEEAVKKHGLTTWEEITAHYRPKVVEKCEKLNPTGFCCREIFKKEVEAVQK